MAEMTIEANTGNLEKVLAFLDAELDEAGCGMKVQTQMDIAVEELFVNIASYAYAPGEGSVTIRVDTAPEPKTVTVTFFDSGTPYDPLEKPDPDVTLSADERQIGGLGIFMVKKSMDAMHYERREGQNILTIVKKLA